MITVYSLPACPMCELLKEKLKEKGVAFEEVQNRAILAEKGIDHVPCLARDGQLMNFATALKWVENYEC